MKVLITTEFSKSATNGVVTSVNNLMQELEENGHEVRLIALSEKGTNYKDGNVYYIKSLPAEFIYPGIRVPVSYHNAMIQELIEWKPDVIHSQCEFFSYEYAKRIAKKTNAPLIHTYHTLYEDYVTYVLPSKKIGKYAVKNFSHIRLKSTNVIIAPTAKVEEILKDYGIENDICVVPTGLDLKAYKAAMSEKERAIKKQSLGIPKEHKVLISLGRLGTEKNIEELLYYFVDVLKTQSKLTFLIVGDGPNRGKLEELSRELNIEENVVFAGMVPSALVGEYYQLGDIFLSASTSETQGLTYVEAAANGLPLLCRRDDCLLEIIEEGVNGFQYTNANEFLERIEFMLNEETWRTNAGKRSEEIAEKFDRDTFGNTILSIYEETIDKMVHREEGGKNCE